MSSPALRLLAGVAAALVFAAPGWAQETAPATDAAAETPAADVASQEDPVVATVNGNPILLSEVLLAIQAMPDQYRQLPVELLIPVMAEQVALSRLVTEQAEAAGMREDPEVLERVERTMDSVIQQVWLERRIDEMVTDAAVEEAYQSFVDANPPVEEIRARHILVDTQEEAEAIIERLNAGEDFAAVADETTTDPSGQGSGGELGWFSRGQMVSAFEEAAFALEPGSYSETPVQTQFGWHVVQVEDERVQPPPSLDEMRPHIEAQLGQRYLGEILEQIKAEAEIVVLTPETPQPDAAPAEDGSAE